MVAAAPVPPTDAAVTDGSPGAGRVTLSGVSQRFRSASGDWTDALGPIDLDLEPGSFVSLVGPSGCGKSTLLRLIAGFDRPDAGSVTVGDRIVAAPGPDRGVVFQQPNLYPWLTVAGNVEFGPRRRRVPRSERATLVAEHLELVGLSEFAGHRPYELSGGMQQRVQLARVLANRPSIVLMDEPFGALDALTRDRLQDELLRIWRVARPTVLFITHSVEEAIYLGTRVLVLSPRPGRVVADLRPDFSTSGAHGPEVRSDRDFVEMRARVGAYLQ